MLLLLQGLGTLVDSPAVSDFAKQGSNKAHFTTEEITKAYQDSFEKTLEAIRHELAGKPSLLSSKLRRDFSAQIRCGGVDSEALRPFVKQKAKLFQIDNLSETNLAGLINPQSTVAFTGLLLEQMQQIAPLSDNLMAFLRQDDFLGQAMLFFLREQFRTDERFDKTLAALQQESAMILFNQQRMLALMEKLHLSSQVKACDEFTRHDTETQRLIQQSVFNLKHLSSEAAEYMQLTLMVGCACSSTGDLAQSEALFSQVIDNTPRDEEKALAYFNRFHVRLRRKACYTALADLQAAIDLNPQGYALHDVETYPMLELLGAGGMGCVFLCKNNNPLIAHEKVVVKCFWETFKGAPEKVFKEAVAMRKIAGDYVPEPLQAAYANVHEQKRAYFVTEYLEGTIDGEAWLEKYGTMDLKTGWQVALSLAQCLQVAHNKGIFNFDLKPANILLTDSPAAVPLKIIDFGLAQIAPTLQQFGQAVQPSARSDVFAFGATMYRFWTGLSSFSERQLPNVPALRELLFDCVEENPNKRPDSAREVLERFKSIEATQQKIREDENAWQKAQDTKSTFEAYLKGKRLKKSAVAAKNRLQAIEAEDDSNDEVEECPSDTAWQEACQKDSEAAYQAYLDGDTLKRHAGVVKRQFLSLSLFNPLNYLRLLWWILIMHQRLRAHRAIYGDKEQKRVGKWLASTLI
ncbi:MAG: protein kinase [Pseudomonadota bacterium]